MGDIFKNRYHPLKSKRIAEKVKYRREDVRPRNIFPNELK